MCSQAAFLSTPEVPNQGRLCAPREHFTVSGDMFCCRSLWGGGGVRALLASSGWRTGMLLSIPQCPGWPPQQRIVQPFISFL